MIELMLTCLIGLSAGSAVIALWMFRAVSPRVALHREH
jgi:hypothetical protein